MKTKICKKCGIELDVKMFYKRKASRDGFRHVCKKCMAEDDRLRYEIDRLDINKLEKQKEYYKINKIAIAKRGKIYNNNHKIEIAERNKNYRSSHKAELAKYGKEYNQINKETIAKYQIIYRKNNKEILIENALKYRSKNRDKCNVVGQRRRAIKKSLSCTLTTEQWVNVKQKFDNSCAYCGKKLKLQQEHFISISKGGEYTLNNIIPSCQKCNGSKNNKDFFEWYPKYKYFSKKRETKLLKYLNYSDQYQQLSIL